MTATELLRIIRASGGKLWVSHDEKLAAKKVPRSLLPDIQLLRSDLITIIQQEDLELLTGPWRVLGSSDFTWRGAKYRWKKIEKPHGDECGPYLDTVAGSLCSRCYPYIKAEDILA